MKTVVYLHLKQLSSLPACHQDKLNPTLSSNDSSVFAFIPRFAQY
jgi:hypothetical protein